MWILSCLRQRSWRWRRTTYTREEAYFEKMVLWNIKEIKVSVKLEGWTPAGYRCEGEEVAPQGPQLPYEGSCLLQKLLVRRGGTSRDLNLPVKDTAHYRSSWYAEVAPALPALVPSITVHGGWAQVACMGFHLVIVDYLTLTSWGGGCVGGCGVGWCLYSGYGIVDGASWIVQG